MIRADDAVRRVNSLCSQAKQSRVKLGLSTVSLKFCWCLVVSGKLGCVGIFIVRSVNEFSEGF
jgi:hypothetical protein